MRASGVRACVHVRYLGIFKKPSLTPDNGRDECLNAHKYGCMVCVSSRLNSQLLPAGWLDGAPPYTWRRRRRRTPPYQARKSPGSGVKFLYSFGASPRSGDALLSSKCACTFRRVGPSHCKPACAITCVGARISFKILGHLKPKRISRGSQAKPGESLLIENLSGTAGKKSLPAPKRNENISHLTSQFPNPVPKQYLKVGYPSGFPGN